MLKKLIYKSHYRGTKEGDFLLSPFARHVLDKCSEIEKNAYAALLEHTDAQIHEWVLNTRAAPEQFQEITLRISEFHNLLI